MKRSQLDDNTKSVNHLRPGRGDLFKVSKKTDFLNLFTLPKTSNRYTFTVPKNGQHREVETTKKAIISDRLLSD